MSQCTNRLVDKPHDTKGNGPSSSTSLYANYSDLRNESQSESWKRVGQLLPDDFIKFMIKETEKPRPEQKASESQAEKNRRKLF